MPKVEKSFGWNPFEKPPECPEGQHVWPANVQEALDRNAWVRGVVRCTVCKREYLFGNL